MIQNVIKFTILADHYTLTMPDEQVFVVTDAAESYTSTISSDSSSNHDDFRRWNRFPYYWPFVVEIHRWPVDSHRKRQLNHTISSNSSLTLVILNVELAWHHCSVQPLPHAPFLISQNVSPLSPRLSSPSRLVLRLVHRQTSSDLASSSFFPYW